MHNIVDDVAEPPGWNDATKLQLAMQVGLHGPHHGMHA
jgi:hypothetical protein